ncbi:hypothetical protein AM596_15840 [Clostridium perfringens CP4]|uniref:hypothetical protein n=1 Tax=Clostridium perfringens TaxID=1502 RepID=UPI0007073213|nr:hypothetical protein [Clostridium perfringens]KQC91216.1 hypothetical protein AM596_15840 [Clostridium perfringens CP4]
MRKVFTDNLPRYLEGRLIGRVNWKMSIGIKIYFVYEDIKGEVIIINYIQKQQKLILKYNKSIFEIKTSHFLNGNIGKIVGKKTVHFKVDIGSNFNDNTKNITIIDRKYRKKYKEKIKWNQKWYKYHCNKCGNEDWIEESHLLNNRGCSVCSGRIAKLGINTIWDTNRWMCDLGVSEEDAKKYTSRSGQKITVKCPDCGREKEMTLNQIYAYKSICCICSDNLSYPEKFIINILNQLNADYLIQYSPKWIKPKRYDFYLKEGEYIIESHGRQHYEKNIFKYCGGRSLEEERENDRYKKETALNNGIKHYIELDCRESSLEYIKNSVLNSELSQLFDLSKIDWKQCAEFANKNIVKEVCEYWNNRKEDETTKNLAEIFKLSRSTITRYLKRGTKLDWCNYDEKEEKAKTNRKNSQLCCKKVEIFKDNQSLGVFKSCADLSKLSEKIFNVKLSEEGISSACRGKRTEYKGFIFKYIND